MVDTLLGPLDSKYSDEGVVMVSFIRRVHGLYACALVAGNFLQILIYVRRTSLSTSDAWNGAIFTNQDIISPLSWIKSLKCWDGPHRSKCGRFSETFTGIRVPNHLKEFA